MKCLLSLWHLPPGQALVDKVVEHVVYPTTSDKIVALQTRVAAIDTYHT